MSFGLFDTPPILQKPCKLHNCNDRGIFQTQAVLKNFDLKLDREQLLVQQVSTESLLFQKIKCSKLRPFAILGNVVFTWLPSVLKNEELSFESQKLKMYLLVILFLLPFCSSQNTRYPPPMLPPCEPLTPTKDNCLIFSCTCSWCSNGKKYNGEELGECFPITTNKHFLSETCGNYTVHTHDDSLACDIRNNVLYLFLFIGLAFFIFGITVLCCSGIGHLFKALNSRRQPSDNFLEEL